MSRAHLIRTLCLAIALTGLSCLSVSDAQAAKPAVGATPVAGGWQAVSRDDPQVQAMAKFAVAKHAESSQREFKLVSVLHAEQQVVAGINYKISMLVAQRNKKQRIVAKVWSKPDGTQELSSWIVKH